MDYYKRCEEILENSEYNKKKMFENGTNVGRQNCNIYISNMLKICNDFVYKIIILMLILDFCYIILV